MCSFALRRRDHVHYCYQEKGTHGAILFQDKGSGALLFSGERNLRSTAYVFRRRGLVHYCSREKGDGAVLIGFIGFIYINPKSLSVYLDKIFHTDNG